MGLRNTQNSYGSVSRAIHWVMALAIIAMFALGYWMVRLTYYSPWYNTAPNIHKSVGILLLILLVFRVIWRAINISPNDSHLDRYERSVSRIVHWLFYPLLLGLMLSGYLISTADGRSVSVFGWFDVPSIIKSKGMEDLAGEIHEILAYITIGLAALHAAAALKHHYIDRDVTLARMLTSRTQSS